MEENEKDSTKALTEGNAKALFWSIVLLIGLEDDDR